MTRLFLFFFTIALFASPSFDEINTTFEQVAQEYNVPASILKVIAYRESNWNHYMLNHTNQFGIMGLHKENYASSIANASSLTGYSDIEILSNYKKNIQGSAAILSDLVNKKLSQGIIISKIDDYSSVLTDYYLTQPDMIDITRNYMISLYKNINNGYTVKNEYGEFYVDGETIDFLEVGISIVLYSEPSNAIWKPSPNYSSRPNGIVSHIVVHTCQGGYSGCVSWLRNPDANASAHYVVSRGGEISQLVEVTDKAWHAGGGSPNYNDFAVGIEHEGWVSVADNYTEELYQASGLLSKYLTENYPIPKKRSISCDGNYCEPGLIGHVEIPYADHTDPGIYWNWQKYMDIICGGTFDMNSNSCGNPNSSLNGSVRFVRPIADKSNDNPVVFRAKITGNVKTVKYFAESNYKLGESTNAANEFEFIYTYSGVDRVREVWARGYDAEGKEIVISDIGGDAFDYRKFTPTEGGTGTVEFIKPTNGQTVSNPVVFESNGSGDVSKVEYFAEELSLSEVTGGNPYHYERLFNTIGARIVSVYGLNANGVIMDIKTIPITVKADSVRFTKPLNGETIENPVVVESEVTGTGIVKVQYFANGYDQSFCESVTAPYHCERLFDTIGARTLTVKGLNANNEVLDEQSINVTVNEQPHTGTLTITKPTLNEETENPVSFESSVSGDIVKVKYYEGETLLGESSTNPFNVMYSFSSYGLKTVKAVGLANDNTIVDEETISFKVIETQIEYQLAFQGLTDNGTVPNPVTISLSASQEIVKIKLFDNGTELNELTSPFTRVETFTEGSHILVAKGLDANGNSLKTIFITINVTAEQINPVKNSSSSGCNYGSENNSIVFLMLLTMLFVINRKKQLK